MKILTIRRKNNNESISYFLSICVLVLYILPKFHVSRGWREIVILSSQQKKNKNEHFSSIKSLKFEFCLKILKILIRLNHHSGQQVNRHTHTNGKYVFKMNKFHSNIEIVNTFFLFACEKMEIKEDILGQTI